MKWARGIALLMIAAVFAYVAWCGLFTPIQIREEQWNPVTCVYKTHTGPYRETAGIMDAVYEHLLSQGVKSSMGIGIYFDNPENVDKSKLRSAAGCVVPAGISDDVLKGSQYKKTTIPGGGYVVVDFPNRGTASVFIGIMRVYPKLNAYLSAKGIKNTAVIEIYDGSVELIHYLVPVEAGAVTWEAL